MHFEVFLADVFVETLIESFELDIRELSCHEHIELPENVDDGGVHKVVELIVFIDELNGLLLERAEVFKHAACRHRQYDIAPCFQDNLNKNLSVDTGQLPLD